MAHANRDNAKAVKLVCGEADLEGASFRQANLQAAHLNSSNAQGARFEGAILQDAELTRAVLKGANLRNADLRGARLNEANLAVADLVAADFTEANIADANLHASKGAGKAHHLHKTYASPDARYFDTVERSWNEKLCSWEVIRTIGNLRLFAVSYTLLAFLMTAFYLGGLYNEKVELARGWADEVSQSHGQTQKLGHDLAERTLASQIQKHVHPYLFTPSTVVLFGSTFVLVVASVIYTLGCPEEIKQFTQLQWRFQLNRSLVHYWALAWKYRPLRILCAALYLIGGAGLVPILAWKLLLALYYVWTYGSIFPSAGV